MNGERNEPPAYSLVCVHCVKSEVEQCGTGQIPQTLRNAWRWNTGQAATVCNRTLSAPRHLMGHSGLPDWLPDFQ